VFITKLDPTSANSLIYSTYLGGSGDEGTEEFGHAIAVDDAGNATVTGNTFSSNFPTFHAPQATLGGGETRSLASSTREVLP